MGLDEAAVPTAAGGQGKRLCLGGGEGQPLSDRLAEHQRPPQWGAQGGLSRASLSLGYQGNPCMLSAASSGLTLCGPHTRVLGAREATQTHRPARHMSPCQQAP